MAEVVLPIYLGYKVSRYVSRRYKDGKMRARAPEIELGHQKQVYQVLSGLVAGMYAADRVDEADTSAWWGKLGYEELSLKDMHYPETELAQVGESHCRVRLSLFRRKSERMLSQPVGIGRGQSQPTTMPLPKYVVAIRGIIPERSTTMDILSLGLTVCMRCLYANRKYFEAAESLISQIVRKFSAQNVCVTGHELGAAIALVASRKLALQGKVLDTHLFNAPNFSLLEFSMRVKDDGSTRQSASPFAVAAVAKLKAECEELQRASWTPHLYANPKDALSRKYMKLFKSKHTGTSVPRKRTRSKDKATPLSSDIITVKAAIVEEVAARGYLLRHLIPAAILYINHWGQGDSEPRKLHQWYKYDVVNLRVLHEVFVPSRKVS